MLTQFLISLLPYIFISRCIINTGYDFYFRLPPRRHGKPSDSTIFDGQHLQKLIAPFEFRHLNWIRVQNSPRRSKAEIQIGQTIQV